MHSMGKVSPIKIIMQQTKLTLLMVYGNKLSDLAAVTQQLNNHRIGYGAQRMSEML